MATAYRITKSERLALFDACTRLVEADGFKDLCSLYDKLCNKNDTYNYIMSGDYLNQ